jgi:hypothetical protein
MKVKDCQMPPETMPSSRAAQTDIDSARIYNRVRRIDVTCRVLFVALAVFFVLFYPKGDFPGEVSTTMLALGFIAILAVTVRFGMKLENPNRE